MEVNNCWNLVVSLLPLSLSVVLNKRNAGRLRATCSLLVIGRTACMLVWILLTIDLEKKVSCMPDLSMLMLMVQCVTVQLFKCWSEDNILIYGPCYKE